MKSIKKKFNLFIGGILTLITVLMLIGFTSMNHLLSNNATERLILSSAKETTHAVSTEIEREVDLSVMLAKNIAVKEWLLDENNSDKKNKAFAQFSFVKDIMRSKNLFVAVDKSKHFYVADQEEGFPEKPMGTLNQRLDDDQWYFNTIGRVKTYDLNVDTDRFLGVVRIWVNAVVYDRENPIGIVGTGMTLDSLINKVYAESSEGIKSVLIDGSGAIQLSKEYDDIYEDSFEEVAPFEYTIFSQIQDIKAKESIRDYLKSPDEIITVDINDKLYDRVTLAPITEVGWHIVTFYDTSSISARPKLFPVMIVGLFVLSIILIIMKSFIQNNIIHPIELLNQTVVSITDGKGFMDPLFMGNDEFEALAKNIREMNEKIEHYTEKLEELVQERSKTLKETFEEIAENEQRLKILLDTLPIGIFKASEVGIIYGNQLFLDIFGCMSVKEFRAEQTHQSKYPFITTEDQVRFKKDLYDKGFLKDYYSQMVRMDGTVIWTELNVHCIYKDNQVLYYEGTIIDITKKLNQNNLLINQATRDTLTGVANRRTFFELLENTMASPDHSGDGICFVLIDFDNFKVINDKYGHLAGDHILIAIIDRIRRQLRSDDLLGRIGGEEFAVLFLDMPHDIILDRVQSILDAVAFEEVFYETMPIHVTISAGISIRRPVDSVQALYRRADDALYEAKRNGKNQFAVHR
ncbi:MULTISPECIES: diguanylate cyclase [unclassified Fusibacter]|uniref:diguanylate cyclase n=1 Tax=unclassified Fusibacter TaxID=2624464 RepID=UPI001011C4BD|nr:MULTISPECIES: diguanylate cyclase [unclassified Fusibacter]MCK8060459.1 diguanylate cyclase [Fusibacter sp. A2]NPE20252.1 diguanylate cyclase [Fusibacter sp. A1]RXV63459.1 diguanylate cyclase [Fusibacter sp. A1]